MDLGSMNRPGYRLATLVAASATVLAWSTSLMLQASLGWAEMERTIGASTGVAVCKESCNRFNDYHDDCFDVPDNEGKMCHRCTLGTTETDRPGEPKEVGCKSSDPGYHFPKGAVTTNCGLIQWGTCKKQACTENLSNSTDPCKQPKIAQEQPGGT